MKKKAHKWSTILAAIIGLSFLSLLATAFWSGFSVGGHPDIMLNPWFLRYAIM